MTGFDAGRREFLATFGSAGIVSIAGCSGGGNGGGTPTDSPTPTATPTTPNQQAVEHYEAAVETLIENKETLEEWAERSFEPDRVSGLQEHVSSARDDLSAAQEAAEPSGELIVQIIRPSSSPSSNS